MLIYAADMPKMQELMLLMPVILAARRLPLRDAWPEGGRIRQYGLSCGVVLHLPGGYALHASHARASIEVMRFQTHDYCRDISVFHVGMLRAFIGSMMLRLTLYFLYFAAASEEVEDTAAKMRHGTISAAGPPLAAGGNRRCCQLLGASFQIEERCRLRGVSFSRLPLFYSLSPFQEPGAIAAVARQISRLARHSGDFAWRRCHLPSPCSSLSTARLPD